MTEVRSGWLGFDGRVFLAAEEHSTYLRRPPVRYAARGMEPHGGICGVCGEVATDENPLHASHLIPFLRGVRDNWLTPEWLDGPYNLVWAHKRICNKAAEISATDAAAHLWERFGIDVEARVEPGQ